MNCPLEVSSLAIEKTRQVGAYSSDDYYYVKWINTIFPQLSPSVAYGSIDLAPIDKEQYGQTQDIGFVSR